MSKQTEALKLALEALVRADRISGYPNNKNTITTIREALAEQPASGLNPLWVATHPDGLTTPQPAQQEPQQPAQQWNPNDHYNDGWRDGMLAAQKAQQQGPEYKGWYCAHCQRGVDGAEVTYHEQHTVCGRVITDDLPPKPQQEPVARVDYTQRDGFHWLSYLGWQRIPDGALLYTSPPARKPWVGLKADELRVILDGDHTRISLALAIQAKLKEKNA